MAYPGWTRVQLESVLEYKYYLEYESSPGRAQILTRRTLPADLTLLASYWREYAEEKIEKLKKANLVGLVKLEKLWKEKRTREDRRGRSAWGF